MRLLGRYMIHQGRGSGKVSVWKRVANRFMWLTAAVKHYYRAINP